MVKPVVLDIPEDIVQVVLVEKRDINPLMKIGWKLLAVIPEAYVSEKKDVGFIRSKKYFVPSFENNYMMGRKKEIPEPIEGKEMMSYGHLWVKDYVKRLQKEE